jgi:type VI secretion system secreted protein VgrG
VPLANERKSEIDLNTIKTPASVELKIDNISVPVPTIEAVTLDQAIGEHHTFAVELRRGTDLESAFGQNFKDNLKAWLGKTISIKISSNEKGQKAAGDVNFMGLITAVDFESVVDGLGKIYIKGYSPTIMLDLNKISSIWHDVKSNDIINNLINQSGLPDARVNASGTSQFTSFLAYYETPFEIIKYLAGHEGWWVYYDGLNFYVTKEAPETSIDVTPNQLSYFTLEADVTTCKKEIVGRNFEFLQGKWFNNKINNKPQTSTSVASEQGMQTDPVSSFSDQQKFPHIPPSQMELDTYLKNRLNISYGQMVKSRGITGIMGLGPGKVLKVVWEGLRRQTDNRREEGFAGQYVILNAAHNFRDGSYYCEFKCTSRDLAYPYYQNELPDQIIETAVVKDNNDPEMLGRIKVQFDWADDAKAESPFIRLAQFHAGADTHGTWMIPEIDDGVVVLIRGHHLENALVIGSIYDGSRKPKSTWPDSKNNFKSICTRSGNEIILSDEKDKEKITITTKDSAAFVLFDASSGAEKMTLGVKKDAASIILEGTEKVTIATKNSSCQISLDGSGQSISIEATKSIKLKASEITLEADSTLSLKSNAQIKQQANASFDIDGGAMVNVKGGLIKLN